MPPETDNPRLEELYKADQSDRERVYDSEKAIRELRHRDAMRRTMAAEFMSHGQVNTANDLYRAGVLFLHGVKPQDFLTAHRLSCMAAIHGHRPARWLAAASLDRFLMAGGQAQVYGTQFEHNAEDNKYQLRLPIEDAGLLSFEKKFFDVPPVLERLAQLNGKIKAGTPGGSHG